MRGASGRPLPPADVKRALQDSVPKRPTGVFLRGRLRAGGIGAMGCCCP